MVSDVKLTANDPVSDQLLSHVSHHVVSRDRKQFATGPLGLSDNQYDNIEEDVQYAERRNYEVNQNIPVDTYFGILISNTGRERLIRTRLIRSST